VPIIPPSLDSLKCAKQARWLVVQNRRDFGRTTLESAQESTGYRFARLIVALFLFLGKYPIANRNGSTMTEGITQSGI
jgi:hypothetical protein